jgi:uncharacterized protein DUF4253
VALPGEVMLVGEPRPGTPVWAIRPDAPAALGWWERLRAEHPRTGLWPVLFWSGIDQGLADAAVWETTALGDYEAEDAGENADEPGAGGAWLTGHDARDSAGLAGMPRGELRAADPEPGDWHTCFAGMFAARPPDAVALVPAVGGWAVPAVLNWWGGANSGVDPAGHSAVLRRWASTWDIELLALDSATMVLRAGRTPGDDRTLLRLAAEACVHCPYSSDLWGGDSLEDRAHLLRRAVWAFWWD